MAAAIVRRLAGDQAQNHRTNIERLQFVFRLQLATLIFHMSRLFFMPILHSKFLQTHRRILHQMMTS